MNAGIAESPGTTPAKGHNRVCRAPPACPWRDAPLLHLIFAPWRRFRAALERGTLPEAARSLNQIRIIVGINLLLGILTVVVGGAGRYW
jgi:hypothetical protein